MLLGLIPNSKSRNPQPACSLPKMQKLKSVPRLNVPSKPIKSLFSFFSSLQNRQIKESPFLNYLIETLNLSKHKALAISNKYPHIKSPENSQSVVQFFQNLGFSDSHIRSSVTVCPQILLSDIDRTLKPKIEFLQQLGLLGYDLGKFISKNSSLLTFSLKKRLIPCVEILKQVLVNDRNNEDLIKVLGKRYLVICIDPESRLLRNITYLKSCGIVGSQLSMLLKRQPGLFIIQESKLSDLVSRALDRGFLIHSGMFVHGLHAVSCLSERTFERKLELFMSYGFMRDELIGMFRKAPGLLRTSDEKLKLGLEFFLNEIGSQKAMLFHAPSLLMYSLEDRIIPRYRVLLVLKSKRLLKKEPSLFHVFGMSEKEFLEKFLARFTEDAEELLVAYKCHMIDS